MTAKVLVAGIGNVFLGDDGFGVEVANRLLAAPPPDGVRIAEYGIRGVHLAYELLDGYDTLVMIDAVPMDEPPGTLAVIRPELPVGGTGTVEEAAGSVDSHRMDPATVLGVLSHIGGTLEDAYVVGCQPATTEPGMALSDSVAAAVEPAIGLVGELLAEISASTRERTTADVPRHSWAGH